MRRDDSGHRAESAVPGCPAPRRCRQRGGSAGPPRAQRRSRCRHASEDVERAGSEAPKVDRDTSESGSQYRLTNRLCTFRVKAIADIAGGELHASEIPVIADAKVSFHAEDSQRQLRRLDRLEPLESYGRAVRDAGREAG